MTFPNKVEVGGALTPAEASGIVLTEQGTLVNGWPWWGWNFEAQDGDRARVYFSSDNSRYEYEYLVFEGEYPIGFWRISAWRKGANFTNPVGEYVPLTDSDGTATVTAVPGGGFALTADMLDAMGLSEED